MLSHYAVPGLPPWATLCRPLRGLYSLWPVSQGFHHPNTRKVGACWGPRFRPGLNCVAPDGAGKSGKAQLCPNLATCRAKLSQQGIHRQEDLSYKICVAPSGLRMFIYGRDQRASTAPTCAKAAHAGDPGSSTPTRATSCIARILALEKRVLG